MAESLIDRYLGSSSNTAASNTPLIDQYLSSINEPAPIEQTDANSSPRSIEELQSRSKLAVPEQTFSNRLGTVGKDYLQSVGEHAQGAVNLMRSGGADVLQGKPATGVGKIGLGAMSYPLSPITGGLHEFIGKPAAKIGGEEFGDKAELLAGSALPIGTATRAISRRLPTNAAIEAITSSVTPSELTEGIQRMKENPRLSIMDVFPSVKQMGQKLVLTEGTHQNKFVKFIEDRIGSRRQAVEDIFHETTGTPPNALMKLNQLKQNIKDAGKGINPIIENANPVDMSSVVQSIDSKLKPGINSIISAGQPLPLGDIEKPLAALRNFITDDKSMRTDPKQLHTFQSALRAKAEDLLHSSTGQDRQLGYALMDVRNQVVNAIEDSAPGYKTALGKYRDENQVDEAFKKGYLVIRNKAGNWEDRPEFWEQWIKSASKEEREAAREGARVAFDDSLNGVRFSGRKGMEIPETPFNRQKLEMLFGKREIDEMSSRLRDERSISESNSDLIKNSQTAMRTKANSKIDLPEKKDSGTVAQLALLAEAAGEYTSGIPGAGALIAGPRLLGAAKHKFLDLPLAKAKNNRLTDLMTSTGDDRDTLIQMLESSLPQPKLSLSQRAKLLTGKP